MEQDPLEMRKVWLNGAAQESNLPSVGLRRRTGFEDRRSMARFKEPDLAVATVYRTKVLPTVLWRETRHCRIAGNA